MERLTRHNINVNMDTDRFLHAAIGGKEIDWKQSRDSTLNVMINGPTSNGFGKDIFRKMARDLYGRLKAYEDTGLSPQACAEAREIDETLSGCDYSISRMVELMKADVEGRTIVLDHPKRYAEIWELFRFCVDIEIECTMERLYDGYAVRFKDGSDIAQHGGTYGATDGCVEPAIGDDECDYSAVGINLAKEIVKKHRCRLGGEKDG